MYKFIVSDLDGTLLNGDHVISDYTKNVLRKLTQQGIYFIFATGRHHQDVNAIKNNLGVDAYMITSNGARVHNHYNELIFSENIDPALVTEIVAFTTTHFSHISTNLYNDDGWLSQDDVSDFEEFFQDSRFNYTRFDLNSCLQHNVAKFFFTADTHEDLQPLNAALKARWADKLNISYSTMTCLEVMAKNVSKGHALERVVTQLDYQLTDCIAFGDGFNDTEMLTMSGKGCIMQNAPQQLKDHLPNLEVIGSNINDGVSTYLSQLFLKK